MCILRGDFSTRYKQCTAKLGLIEDVVIAPGVEGAHAHIHDRVLGGANTRLVTGALRETFTSRRSTLGA